MSESSIGFPHYGKIIGTYRSGFTVPKNCWAKVEATSTWTNTTLTVNGNSVLVQQIQNTNNYPIKTTTWIPLKNGDTVGMSQASGSNGIVVTLYEMR